MQETLVIVKPDAVRRGLIGEILARIERKGLRIAEMRTMRIGRELSEEHYAEHREKPFFDELVGFITSSDVVVARVVGEGAVAVVRELMGPTDPAQAPPGTIRGDFGLRITENLIHGSDSSETAKRELDLFFS
ncbi:MAG TPA: nucleoside-diphosphate kinase [Actinomycetota bacterium]|nr:nucleoside-diphosphate kinase [Actinomycetota bacterium]